MLIKKNIVVYTINKKRGDNMNNKSKGISMALIAAILWGISGNFAEYIFTHSNITDLSYTTFRMLFSGIILLIYGIFLNSFSEFKKLIFDKKTY